MSLRGCEECDWRGWIECGYFRYEIPESGTAVQTCDQCKGDDVGDIDAAEAAIEFYLAVTWQNQPGPWFIGWHGTGSIDDKAGIRIASAGDVWITQIPDGGGAHAVDDSEEEDGRRGVLDAIGDLFALAQQVAGHTEVSVRMTIGQLDTIIELLEQYDGPEVCSFDHYEALHEALLVQLGDFVGDADDREVDVEDEVER
jgi:hypothetical protein